MKFFFAGIFAVLLTIIAGNNASAATAGDRGADRTTSVATTKFGASIYQLQNSNKIRLLVENDSGFRVCLKNGMGMTFYSKTMRASDIENSRIFSFIFDADKLADDIYYIEIRTNGQMLTRKIQIESKSIKKIVIN